MKLFKQILAFLLVGVMLLPMLVACGDKTEENGGGTGTLTQTGSIVPEDVTFDGETFTILCRADSAWGEYEFEIAADEDETELVNQAVYERNIEVEDRFGLELVITPVDGHWAVHEDFVNTFKNSILSASGSFDVIMSQQAYMAEPELTELYCNFNEVPYIKDNLDAEYYYSDVIDEVTVGDKLYYLLGDYSLTYWEYVYVLYFNKTMAENYNLEDIYQLVKDGNWTFDKMVEMTKGVFTDLNGDVYPDPGDSFGYVSDIPNTTDALSSQFDVPMVVKDENGEIVLGVDQAKMVNILEKFMEFKTLDDTHFVSTTSSDPMDSNPADKIFEEGRALFYPAELDRAQDFRGMETDFGIVPYPKWDENQAGYYTHSQDGYSVAVVPIDATNIEKSGAVLDVMSALSYEKVIPAYYDMALKDKYARDDASGEMLDIIREGFRVDFGYFYGPAIGCANVFRVLIGQDNTNFVSFYAVNSKSYERNLKKMLDTYESNGVE